MRIEAVKTMLWVRDMDRAVAFYRDVIGLEARMVTPHWSELAWRDATIGLHGGGDASARDSGLSFQVQDLDGAVAEVVAGGGEVVRPAEDRPGEPIRLANLRDPEGNAFQLSQLVT